MIIKEFHINGFGVFSNMEVRGLSPGMNIFLGDNEAGKSTLLAFIRAILFGFPKKTPGMNQYPPLNGGVHGGSLLIDCEKGKVLVNRAPGPRGGKVALSYQDGSKGDDGDLQSLLKGATSALYNNIYAFSLSELQSLNSLTNHEVASALYGATLGMGIKNLTSARKKISQQKAVLYKPSGVKPEVNRQVQNLVEVAAMLTDAAGDSEKFHNATAKLKALDESISSLKEQEHDLRKALQSRERMLAAWDDWVDHSEAQKWLNSHALDGKAVTRQDYARYESMKGGISRAAQELQDLREEFFVLEIRGRGIVIETDVLDKSEEILKLSSELALYKEDLEAVKKVSQEALELEHEAAQVGRSLGTGWDTQRLLSFNDSLSLRQEMDDFEHRLQKLVGEEAKASQRADLREDTLREVQQEENRLLEQLEERESPPPLWQGNESSAKELMATRLQLAKDIAGAANKQERLEGEIRHLTQRMADRATVRYRQRTTMAGASLMVLALIIAGAFAYGRFPWIYPSMMAIIGGMLGGTILVKGPRGKPGKQFLRKLASTDGAYSGMHKDKLRLKTDHTQLLAHKAQLSQELGIPTPQTMEALHAIDRSLELENQRFRAWARIRESLEDLRQKEEEAALLLGESVKAKEHAARSLASMQADWDDWLSAHSLPSSLSPASAREVLSHIEQVASLLKQARAARERLEHVQARTSRFESSAANLLNLLGQESKELHVPIVGIPELLARLEESRAGTAAKRQLEQTMQSLQGKIRDKATQLEQEKEALQALLAKVGAITEEEFLGLYELSQERSRMKEQKLIAASNLMKVSGERDLDSFLTKMHGVEKDECESGLMGAKEDLARVRKDLDEEITQRAELLAALKGLASNTQVSQIQAEKERAKEKLRTLSMQWAAYAMAEYFLERAVTSLEEKQQPEVIMRASRLFHDITEGRYIRIHAPIGSKGLEVVRGDGARKGTDQLSRGTAELLYLCIRMGYIQTRISQGAALPIVMDDILVNLDKNRASRTAKLFSDLAQDHQTLLFTCHRHSVNLFADHGLAYNLFEMDHRGISRTLGDSQV